MGCGGTVLCTDLLEFCYSFHCNICLLTGMSISWLLKCNGRITLLACGVELACDALVVCGFISMFFLSLVCVWSSIPRFCVSYSLMARVDSQLTNVTAIFMWCSSHDVSYDEGCSMLCFGCLLSCVVIFLVWLLAFDVGELLHMSDSRYEPRDMSHLLVSFANL